ncbi:hypothetical protein ACFQFH_07690 [Halobaculum halobium]|uniref:Uncharacterized protein n=1 Tax=Halobaculum halobium TaxID=3032281 RepID=A0ABD5T942_9EURY|nr:hypothetical protein [Halobaculum sp. SYNS20]
MTEWDKYVYLLSAATDRRTPLSPDRRGRSVDRRRRSVNCRRLDRAGERDGPPPRRAAVSGSAVASLGFSAETDAPLREAFSGVDPYRAAMTALATTIHVGGGR